MGERLNDRSLASLLGPLWQWLDGMEIRRHQGPGDGGWLVVGVKGDKSGFMGDLQDQTLAGAIRGRIDALGWKPGKAPLSMMVGEQRVLLVPGTRVKTSPAQVGRQLGIDAAAFIKGLADTGRPVHFLGGQFEFGDFIEGFCSSWHVRASFRGKVDQDKKRPVALGLAGADPDETAARDRLQLVKGLLLTRLMQDAPANWLNSEKWAADTGELFAGTDAKVTVRGRSELEELGMGSFLSVAAGTPVDPKLITIEIPGDDPSRTVALVGKGLTFDAGGISLKPSAGMGEMKYDMSGGAAVMGAAAYFAGRRPPVNVLCVMGVVENMPSGTATRPGDIVQAMNGKTIEVLNTDAEGRLVLADLLAWTSEKKPDLIFDMATLTGAVLHALGHAGAAFMTDDEKVSTLLQETSASAGEPLWRLPIWPELKQEIAADEADLKNIAKPSVSAGTAVGGAFLREFVDEKIPWAHIDIAGAGWSCNAVGYPGAGGSGFGVRTFVDAVRLFSSR